MSSLIISSLSLILSNINTVSSTIATHTHGDPLSSSCIGKEDGDYWLLLSSDNTDYLPLHLRCSNEYVILDISKDLNLKNYFSSFEKWHHSIGGPANHDPVNWREWFLYTSSVNYNSHSKYILSPDCNTCDESYLGQVYNTDTTYWMTGNLAKLHWFVIGFNECDMDYKTYTCYDCESCMGISGACDPVAYTDETIDYEHAGICGVAVQSSQYTVYKAREIAQGYDQINFKPSIGTDGEYCVCYKPSQDIEYHLNQDQENMISMRENEEKLALLDNDKDETSNKNELDSELSKIEEDTSKENVKNKEKIVLLTQSDFDSGTYRITEPGRYIIMEDIIFDFNKDDDWWPRSDQSDYYIGADGYRDAYHLGFFAGITIESNDVTIDLNSHILRMSVEYYYQQRWFALIEFSNQQFLPGQGPGFFGNDPIMIENVAVINGVLGLTSHFGIHGNFATNILIKNVHIKHFVTHGMQLNGWKNLEMDNVEIGPSSTFEYLKGEYGHGRLMLHKMRKIEDDDTVEMIRDSIKFANHDEELTLIDFADNLEEQMKLAFEYAINRYYGKYKESDYITTIDVINDDDSKQLWKEAKSLFIQESGYPSASSISGLFLNFEGASVFSYTMYTTRQSSNGILNNVYIHDIHHEMVESMRFSFTNCGVQLYPTPWASDIPAEHAVGDKELLYNLWESLELLDTNEYDTTYKNFKYKGTVLTDAYYALGSLVNDWDYLGFLQVTQKMYDRTDMIDWVKGSPVEQDWMFGCNQDIMAHSGKGLLGLRIDGVDNIKLNNIIIENLIEKGELGSHACGEYSSMNREGNGGELKQNLPMQTGFSGNDLQGISIIASTNVLIGDITIKNLYNDYSQAFGLSLWTGNDITTTKDALIKVSNVNAGIVLEKGILTYESRPNRSPEVCGVRLEDSDTADYYASYFEIENNGIDNILVCGVSGHEMCLGENNDLTMYGNYVDDVNTCDEIEDKNDLLSLLQSLNVNVKSQIKGKEKEMDVINNNKIDEDVKTDNQQLFGGYLTVLGSVVVLIVWAISCFVSSRYLKNVNNCSDGMESISSNGYNAVEFARMDTDDARRQYGSI